MAYYIKKPVYLHTPIDFGKYRLQNMSVKEIIDSGVDGLQWVKWILDRSWNFEAKVEVAEYIQKKEKEYGLF